MWHVWQIPSPEFGTHDPEKFSPRGGTHFTDPFEIDFLCEQNHMARVSAGQMGRTDIRGPTCLKNFGVNGHTCTLAWQSIKILSVEVTPSVVL